MGITLVTFFGTGTYKRARYTFADGKEFDSIYFPVALTQQIDVIDKIIVFLTNEAEVQHGKEFKKHLSDYGKGHLPIEEVKIPIGKSEGELWLLFERISKAINGEIIVDITHGLRHFQILTILCLSYLYFSTELKIQGVYYAAFDIGQDIKLDNEGSEEKKTIRITPVFELSPYLSLLSWIEGVNAFNRYGDAGVLGNFLKEMHKTKELTSQHTNETMQKLGDMLEKLSQALMVSRADEVIERLNILSEDIASIKDQIETELALGAKPFSLVAEKVIDDYLTIITANDKLQKRLLLVEWYLNRNHIPQALTLLRETIVSRMIFELDGTLDKEKDKEIRSQAETWLRIHENKGSAIGVEWRKIRILRNDVAHCGFDDKANNARDLVAESKQCFERTLALWQNKRLWRTVM